MLKTCMVLYFCVLVRAHVYNNTDIDLKKCKTHYSRSGSVYKDFYSITDTPGANDTLLVDFHFLVLAPSDAHILLASSDKVQKTDPAYEIVIGAGGNTFCDIRRRQKADVKASVRIKGLLSSLDPQPFWLHVTKDGDIALGREKEELPIISWVDPDPLPLKVISFSTWSGVEAKWYFDCEMANETQEIERPLTHLEKLRQDLLYHYDPYVRPVKKVSDLTTISMALVFNHVTLDETRSIIEVTGLTQLAWQDEKLKWDPNNYGGLQNFHIFRREIWLPDLCLYNAVDDVRDLLEDTLVVAHYTGYVEWNPSLSLKAFCDGDSLGRWPKESHKCNLIIGFMKEFNHLRLIFRRNESSLIYQETSEWSILEADIISDFDIQHLNETSDPAIFEIILTLKRTSNIIDWIFFTPFVFISISTLITFWLTPFNQMKISVGCCQLVFCSFILIGIETVIPSQSNKVPYLVYLYSYTMVAILIAIIVAIVVINVSRNSHRKSVPHLVCKILTNKLLRFCLCLPNIKMPDKYGDLYDHQEKHQTMWIHLGTTIDRLAFVIYLALAIYATILNNNNQ